MMRRIVALALSVLLLLSVCPLSAMAADEAQVVVESSTATQGGYANVYLRADHFVDVSVLDIEVFYDSSVMSVESVSNGSFFSGASVSTNTADVGVVRISAMSVAGFHSTGYTYDDRMITLRFRISGACPAGDYPIRVAVGDAYDSNLAPTAIAGVNGVVTVSKSAVQSFTLSTSCNTTYAQQRDTVTIQVYNSYSRIFAGADFRIEYDRDLLKLHTVELSDGLKVEGAVYSINGDNPGYAAISYASTNAVGAYHLFTLTFEVLADADARADVKLSANEVYNDDLIPYAGYTTTTYFQITKKVEVPDYPDFTVSTVNFELGQTDSAVVTLQGGAEVAAGDFTVHYDKNVFEIVSATADPVTTAAGALIIINPNFNDGEIKFSYVNEKGSFPNDMALVHIVLTAVSAPSEHAVLSATGADVYNIRYMQTQLEYVSNAVCIYVPTVTPPTCIEQGYTTYVCHCGDTYVDSYVPALGHDEIPHEEQVVTCTEIGWDAYVTCSRCDYTTYEEIPALGHDEVYHVAQAPTCTEIGWEAHVTCTRCDYTTYVEIPVVEHTYDSDYDPDCNVCGEIREIPVLPGDVNDDGKVNNRDLGLFQRYLNDWDVAVNPLACDMNEDGRINNRDLAMLQIAINT